LIAESESQIKHHSICGSKSLMIFNLVACKALT
jgi:hypothetical protein